MAIKKTRPRSLVVILQYVWAFLPLSYLYGRLIQYYHKVFWASGCDYEQRNWRYKVYLLLSTQRNSLVPPFYLFQSFSEFPTLFLTPADSIPVKKTRPRCLYFEL